MEHSEEGGIRQMESERTLVPPRLKFTVYFTEKYRSRTLFPAGYDAKSRATREDLESRRDWASLGYENYIGDVYALSPWNVRGREIESPAMRIWDPCFAIVRWGINGCQMTAAVRPPPPYSAWVRVNAAPLTWRQLVAHLDRQLDNDRARRPPPRVPPFAKQRVRPP